MFLVRETARIVDRIRDAFAETKVLVKSGRGLGDEFCAQQ